MKAFVKKMGQLITLTKAFEKKRSANKSGRGGEGGIAVRRLTSRCLMMILTFFSSFFFFDLAVTVITLGCSLESSAVTLVCDREHLTVSRYLPPPPPPPLPGRIGQALTGIGFQQFWPARPPCLCESSPPGTRLRMIRITSMNKSFRNSVTKHPTFQLGSWVFSELRC